MCATGKYLLYFIVLFNNTQTLKFNAKLKITFYTGVSNYCNRHLKQKQTNPRITTQEHDLLNCPKYCTYLTTA